MASRTVLSGPCLAFHSHHVPVSLPWTCHVASILGFLLFFLTGMYFFNRPFPNELDNYPSDLPLWEKSLWLHGIGQAPQKGGLEQHVLFLPSAHYSLRLHVYVTDGLINVCPLSQFHHRLEMVLVTVILLPVYLQHITKDLAKSSWSVYISWMKELLQNPCT